MKISNRAVRFLSLLTATAAISVATGFGPAWAVESSATHRGNGDQTKDIAASRSGLRVGRKSVTGNASYYAGRFHGRRTASGERYNQHAMTLACRKIPMGSRVVVTNLRNGRSAMGRVNDYGPNGRSRHRVADLSRGLARKIGLTASQGVTRVRLDVVSR